MSSPDRLLTGLAIPSAAGYLALALVGDLKADPWLYLSLHAALSGLYLAAILASLREPRGEAEGARWTPAVVVGAAVVYRLILLPSPPSLSDDIWRYLWEGGLQLQGVNPYAHAPSDPALVGLRDGVYDGVNYKDLPAIYPPLMEWVFALGAALGRTTTAMKAIFVAADVVLILLLAGLCRRVGLPMRRALIYAWNPLVVVEVAGSGHNDSLAMCFLVASTVGILAQRRVLSIVGLGLSAAAKLFPLMLLPLYARRTRPAQLLIPPCLLAACYLPYMSAGQDLLRSTREYAERWRTNDSLFAVIVKGVELSGISPVAKGWADARGLDSLYTQPHMIARGIAAAIALGVLIGLSVRKDAADPLGLPRSIYLFTATALLLHPVLHPWYLIWIAPWLSLFPSPAWVALTVLAPLSYMDWSWARTVEYTPFFALMAVEWQRRRSGPIGVRSTTGRGRT